MEREEEEEGKGEGDRRRGERVGRSDTVTTPPKWSLKPNRARRFHCGRGLGGFHSACPAVAGLPMCYGAGTGHIHMCTHAHTPPPTGQRERAHATLILSGLPSDPPHRRQQRLAQGT